jgi:hypothetical protein
MDNRIAWIGYTNYAKLGASNSPYPTSLQDARVEMQRIRDVFRNNLQDPTFNPQADNNQYRVSNIQEIGRQAFGTTYRFMWAFIVRDILNNMEWMFIYTGGQYHWTTGVWQSGTDVIPGLVLNAGTTNWTTDLILSPQFNSSSLTWASFSAFGNNRPCRWILFNNNYTASTWGGSWEFPTFATSYTLDFIRASAFGANVLSGDPASAGPNPAASGAGGFADWFPANFVLKSGYGYDESSFDSANWPKQPLVEVFIFDKALKVMLLTGYHPLSLGRTRILIQGEIFDTFANGGLADPADTKPFGTLLYEINNQAAAPANLPSLSAPAYRRFIGLRSNGTTPDPSIDLQLVGDRTSANYVDSNNDFFVRKIVASNTFTTKGTVKPSLLLECGPFFSTSSTLNTSYLGLLCSGKHIEYPDSDNPMLHLGQFVAFMWKKDLGPLFGLTFPETPTQ